MMYPARDITPTGGEAPAANILLVDDRPDKLLALTAILGELKQNLVKVRSGDEALRQLLKRDFAVILLDVNMPGLDGFETAALIRKRRRSEATPIIFISATNDTVNHVSRGYSLGAVDYILSPIVPEILRAKVAVFVDLFLKTEQVKRQAEEHAQLLQEQAARARAEEERGRMAYLADASNVLAGSLDYEQTFSNLARLVVPRLADLCVIDRKDSDGTIRRMATTHRDPEAQRTSPESVILGSPGWAFQMLESETPFVRSQLDPRHAGFLAEDAEDGPENLGPIAIAVIPIVARGSITAAITMARTAPVPSFTDGDLWLAGELAQRTALALDNVELYRKANAAREEAETANRAKDRFLAMLSHELRTPLTPVLTHLLTLASDARIPDELHHSLEVIRRNVELEARLIDDLLDLTRVESGRIHLETEVVDLREIVGSALDICRHDIETKGLELRIDLPPEPRHVRADPARLQQVFWNIVKNAVKFTVEGSISVSESDAGSEVTTIVVRDTGIGIDASLIGRIFHPFEQAERGGQGGLGLGLAITKALVELHGGEISVTSDGRNKGTAVRISLPLAGQIPSPAPVVKLPTGAPDHKLRVLLLEDHPDTNEALTMLLRLRGYSVMPALTVASGLELAAEHEFDLLLSDLGLPDGCPGAVLEKLASRGVVGIALSGLGMEKDVRRSLALGFRHHLVKPVDVARLEEILQECGDVVMDQRNTSI